MKKIIDYIADEFKNEKLIMLPGLNPEGLFWHAHCIFFLGCGFIPIRKPGKLPCETISMEYDLEYGTDKIEIHKDAIEKGKRVLLIDDLLADRRHCSCSQQTYSKRG